MGKTIGCLEKLSFGPSAALRKKNFFIEYQIYAIGNVVLRAVIMNPNPYFSR